jgi:hypothetical protein
MVCLAWNPRCESEVCNFTSAESPDCMLKTNADQAINYKTMMTGPDTNRQTMLCVRLGENVTKQVFMEIALTYVKVFGQ